MRARDWLGVGTAVAATAGALALGGYMGMTVRFLGFVDHVFTALLRAVLS